MIDFPSMLFMTIVGYLSIGWLTVLIMAMAADFDQTDSVYFHPVLITVFWPAYWTLLLGSLFVYSAVYLGHFFRGKT